MSTVITSPSVTSCTATHDCAEPCLLIESGQACSLFYPPGPELCLVNAIGVTLPEAPTWNSAGQVGVYAGDTQAAVTVELPASAAIPECSTVSRALASMSRSCCSLPTPAIFHTRSPPLSKWGGLLLVALLSLLVYLHTRTRSSHDGGAGRTPPILPTIKSAADTIVGDACLLGIFRCQQQDLVDPREFLSAVEMKFDASTFLPLGDRDLGSEGTLEALLGMHYVRIAHG